MKDPATLTQGNQVGNLLAQRNLSSPNLQQLLATTLLAHLFDASKKVNLFQVDPFAYMDLLGVPVPKYILHGKARECLRNDGPSLGINLTPFMEGISHDDVDQNMFTPLRLVAVNRKGVYEVSELFDQVGLHGGTRTALLRFASRNRQLEHCFTGRIIGLGSYARDDDDPPEYRRYPFLDYDAGFLSGCGRIRGDSPIFNGGRDCPRRYFFLVNFPSGDPDRE